MKKTRFITLFLFLLIFCSSKVSSETYYFDSQSANKNLSFYKTNKGYEKQDKITKNDMHYGWSLGNFEIYGYSANSLDTDVPEFYKNIDNQVVLKFNLKQDINKINGEKIEVIEEKRGQDVPFETEETNFGKGTLIVKYTSLNNSAESPKIYTDFLTGKSKNAKNMEVALNQEVMLV